MEQPCIPREVLPRLCVTRCTQTGGPRLGAMVEHLSTAEAALEKLRVSPLFAPSFFALCHLVRTHRTVAFRESVVLINNSQRFQPSKHTGLCCWHQPHS